MHYIGDPHHQLDFWEYQGLPDNCAVAAQASIINQFLPDHDLSLDQANYITAANGWYHPGSGTSPDDVGKLFEVFDIPYHRVDHATLPQLAEELQAGHRVIVGVHSAELWDQGPLSDLRNWVEKAFGLDNSRFSPADHALCVTAVDVRDPAHPMVVVNDPGDPNGAGHLYSLDRFMDAWSNSDCFYVATDFAPTLGAGTADLGGFDIGDYLGFGTTAVAALAGSPISNTVEAGTLVTDICLNADWDEILASI
jgi:hypothetical protein